jgi:hypothetical protein
MAVPRWNPAPEVTGQEEWLIKRLNTKRKLFRFLRLYRHELFDEAFQTELEAMYRDTGAGKEPIPPALMAMAVLLQGYDQLSDAEAVEHTVMDLRWQLVLGRLGATKPAFSQGALYDFRHRLIRHDLDRRLLERTVELARRTKEFDWKKVPANLRVAVDSAPLQGAGRVEDTFNLLGHAARMVVACVVSLLHWPTERVCTEAGIPVLLESSVKKALDVDWTNREQKAEVLQTLLGQINALERWIGHHLPAHASEAPLKTSLATLRQILEQDLEPDPHGGGRKRIRKGVAPDRRISIRDREMRHGRKSKSQRINGYKRHIASDLDTDLIVGCAVTPANRPEGEAAPELHADLKHQGLSIGQLYIDRAYIGSGLVDVTLELGGDVFCRPWTAQNTNAEVFTKADFHFDMRARTITCPAGQSQPFQLGTVVQFDAATCDGCSLREQCVTASLGHGRLVRIREDEQLQHRLRKQIRTTQGRARLRKRVAVEHRLAHIVYRQGRRARYFGTRDNLFDLRRAATLQNLETIQRKLAA